MARFTLGFRLISWISGKLAESPDPTRLAKRYCPSVKRFSRFLSSQFPEDPQSFLRWSDTPCPSGQITLGHTSTPVALTP